MLSDLELMTIHVATLFTQDNDQRLHTINESDGDLAPRFFLGRTNAGNIWRFRHDLPDSLVNSLQVLASNEVSTGELSAQPTHFEKYLELLQANAPIQEMWMGPAYRVPITESPAQTVRITPENPELLRGGFDGVRKRLDEEQPCIAIVQENRAVSICRSVRVTQKAHEAGVATLPAFRGRRFAAQVVAGWATAVSELDAIPLYSTSWENKASQSVARKLNLEVYGVTFHVT